MASYTGQPRVWSLWIYDRHCCLLFHADWSTMHNRPAVNNSSSSGGGSSGAAAAGTSNPGGASSSSASAPLSLSEQSKLVYGVVFSLRNMTRKMSPQDNNNNKTSQQQQQQSQEAFQSFSTSSYTLSHLQLSTKYTFIMITDPIAPPTRRAPTSSTSSSSTGSAFAAAMSSSSSVVSGGGGGIPSTGGMSTTGVLSQIARGPWLDFVVRNPACSALERMEEDEDDDDDSIAYQNGGDHIKEGDDDDDDDDISSAKRKEERKMQRKKAKDREQEKQRLTGIGKSIDSEAFRAAVERVLSQNKLSAPRM